MKPLHIIAYHVAGVALGLIVGQILLARGANRYAKQFHKRSLTRWP